RSMPRPPKREREAPSPDLAPPRSTLRPARTPALASAPCSPEVARFGVSLAVVRTSSPVEPDDDVDTGVFLTPALLAAIRTIAPANHRSKRPSVMPVPP